MDLRHFFEGKLRKEEMSSAYLATLLEGDEGFRTAFLERVFRKGAPSGSWQVSVEASQVDVTLTSDEWIVIIENKVAAGAFEAGQLLRYYRTAISTASSHHVAAVYLAPRNLGKDEVDRVAEAARQGDVSCHLSWDSMDEIVERCSSENRWFAASGLAAIQNAIKRAREVRYPPDEVRLRVRDLAASALDMLQDRVDDVELRGWSSKDREEIFTVRSNITMWLHAIYKTTDEPPFDPVDVVHDGHVRVRIEAKCKLAGKVKRTTELAKMWSVLLGSDRLEVPHVGTFVCGEKDWLEWSELVDAPDGAVAERMAEVGAKLLERLRPFLVQPA
jgi:hypothetical protein